jgi:hypothetical protein
VFAPGAGEGAEAAALLVDRSSRCPGCGSAGDGVRRCPSDGELSWWRFAEPVLCEASASSAGAARAEQPRFGCCRRCTACCATADAKAQSAGEKSATESISPVHHQCSCVLQRHPAHLWLCITLAAAAEVYADESAVRRRGRLFVGRPPPGARIPLGGLLAPLPRPAPCLRSRAGHRCNCALRGPDGRPNRVLWYENMLQGYAWSSTKTSPPHLTLLDSTQALHRLPQSGVLGRSTPSALMVSQAQGSVHTSSRGRAARKAAATARSWGAGRRSAVSQRSRHCGQLAGPDRSWYSMLLRTHPEQTAGTKGLQSQSHCLCDGGAVAYNKWLQPCTAMLRPARNVHIGHGSCGHGLWA